MKKKKELSSSELSYLVLRPTLWHQPELCLLSGTRGQRFWVERPKAVLGMSEESPRLPQEGSCPLSGDITPGCAPCTAPSRGGRRLQAQEVSHTAGMLHASLQTPNRPQSPSASASHPRHELGTRAQPHAVTWQHPLSMFAPKYCSQGARG